jgi:hypothetical protein
MRALLLLLLLLLLAMAPIVLCLSTSRAPPAEEVQRFGAVLWQSDPTLAMEVFDPAEAAVIASWANTKLPGPPLIETEKQLADFGPFISPVLHGDLGSIMFQLAAVHVLAQSYSTTCVVAWWDQSDKSLPEQYRPFGGRGEPAPGITLKHNFPALAYASFEPSYRGVLGKQLCRSERRQNGALK